MGQAIPVRADYTVGEVRQFANRAKDAAQARRLLAIAGVLVSNRSTSLTKKKPSAHHAGLCRAVLPRPAAERLHLSVINGAGSVLNAAATEFLHVSMYAAAVLHPSRTSDQLLSLCVPKGGASSLDSAPPCVGGAFFVSIFSRKEAEQASRADDGPRPGNPLE